MIIARQLSELSFNPKSVVTVGSFDGVHRAHAAIISEVVSRARQLGGRSVVVTFEPHPREIVGTRFGMLLLTTLEEKERLFAKLGVDVVLVIPFTNSFSQQSSAEFFEKYLVRSIGACEVVEGFNHHFGKNREGNPDALLKLGAQFGVQFIAVKPLDFGGVVVNSSRIRTDIESGKIESANDLLGHQYAISGNVIEGDKRGRTLGFPTANLQPDSSRKLIPQNGIYFVRVEVLGTLWFGMASVGVRPTFYTNGQRLVETNILEFDREIYGEHITFTFLKRLRDELKFESVDALVEQMNKDKAVSLELMEHSI
jgi:riboflavin kinase/FMN adenylyltransferase